MFELGWFGKSLAAAVLYVPWTIAIGFFSKNYGVRPEATMLWYFLGIIVSAFGIFRIFGILTPADYAPSGPLFVVFVLGLVFGGVSNVLAFQAIASAPNPGLSLAVINAFGIFTFFTAIVCAAWAPKWFSAARFDWYHLIGIALTFIGISLIAIRR